MVDIATRWPLGRIAVAPAWPCYTLPCQPLLCAERAFPWQVEDLARLSFKRAPLYVGIDDQGPTATREGLEQGYCVVPSAQRFLLLFTFLKKNVNKKVRPGMTSAPRG